MANFSDQKSTIAMLGLQFIYAGVSVTTRAALLQGMSPRIFVVYRQTIAFLLVAPITLFRRKGIKVALGWRSFWLIFFATLIGVTINQNIFFEGLYLASSSVGSAMGNLVPAVTFIMACTIGMEKIHKRSLRSVAKIFGTVFCVCGAITMALLRGPKLLNSEFLPEKSLLGSRDNDWLVGTLLLLASSCCWSLWLILQVPVSASHPDHLSLTAWMCFMGMLQSGAVALFFDRDLESWRLHSNLELGCCFYTGLSSAISFLGQAWCISRRGPLFSAMFNPLCTVIVTIFACIFLHEEIYTGSLIGAIAVVAGLYMVLWGKAKDTTDSLAQIDQGSDVQILIDESSDLEEPLLAGRN